METWKEDCLRTIIRVNRKFEGDFTITRQLQINTKRISKRYGKTDDEVFCTLALVQKIIKEA